MLFVFLATVSFINADPNHNYLMPYLLSQGGDGKSDNDLALTLMMAQNAHHGGSAGAQQMSAMLPLIMMSKKSDTGSSDNTAMMMMMLMQQPNAIRDPSMLMPFILMQNDDNSKSTDLTSLFLMTSMMQSSCSVDTNKGIGSIAPLLMVQENNKDDTLKSLLMLQMMSPGKNAVGLSQMLPFVLLMDDNNDNPNNLLTMVMLSSAMGGLDTQDGFGTNFNMLLPFAMKDCTSGDTECAAERKKMMVLLMAMQSSAPGSPMTSQQILPLMLMKDGSNNEELIIFMSMMSQLENCNEDPVYITDPLPEDMLTKLVSN